MWLWGTFLVVISCIRLPMNNYQANVNTNPLKFLYFYYKTVFILTFLTFFHYPNFSIITIHCINKTNTMTCAIKREVWTWYLPSHLVPDKILCSRFVLNIQYMVLFSRKKLFSSFWLAIVWWYSTTYIGYVSTLPTGTPVKWILFWQWMELVNHTKEKSWVAPSCRDHLALKISRRKQSTNVRKTILQ